MPLAYFITFSTYGTWLPGSEKGLGSVDRDHNVFETPFIEPDAGREHRAAERMKSPPFVLDEAKRNCVRDSLVSMCSEKGWTLLALHARSNHVHVVVSADREPGRLMSDFKARASRDLNRAERAAHEVSGEAIDKSTKKRWTRHGSTRYLFDDDSVAAAVAYTLDGQGTPMATFDPRVVKKEPRTK